VTLYEIDPICDPRWNEFVERHEGGSIFHTAEWLDALRTTYQYEPVAFTDAAPGERVNNGLLFCRVRSWMTGSRMVSLPFSDHCEPLVQSSTALDSMLDSVKGVVGRHARYIEIRPRQQMSVPAGFAPSAAYCLHSIDLRPELDTIFSRFHKSHIQRSVRKAERLGLQVDVGRSSALVDAFCALHVLTRRRLGVPVQPVSWFRNLVESLGDRLTVYLATHRGHPAAAIVTAVQKRTLVYKYGSSDTAYNRYGGTTLLFWRAIQRAKEEGAQEFDLGRSDLDNEGLIAFKDHLGATRRPLTYYRYSLSADSARSWTPSIVRRAYALVPKRIQGTIGSALYRHFG